MRLDETAADPETEPRPRGLAVVAPEELREKLEELELTILKTQGVSFDALNWDWKLSSDVDVNYMIVAAR